MQPLHATQNPKMGNNDYQSLGDEQPWPARKGLCTDYQSGLVQGIHFIFAIFDRPNLHPLREYKVLRTENARSWPGTVRTR